MKYIVREIAGITQGEFNYPPGRPHAIPQWVGESLNDRTRHQPFLRRRITFAQNVHNSKFMSSVSCFPSADINRITQSS